MEGSMENLNINSGNPLAELISDDIYSLLASRGLIDEKSVRDYIIRKKFKSLRLQKISASEAIENLRSEYPYLQFDTIRKIVYQPKN
jgi:flavin-dependent dehydrogenase